MRYFNGSHKSVFSIHRWAAWFLLPVCLIATSGLAGGDSLYVVVNTKNQLQSLPLEEIENIFLGKINSYPNGKEVYLVTLNKKSEPHKTFLKEVVHKSEREWRSHWARLLFTGRGKAPKEVASEQEMLRLVAEKDHAIGYVVAPQIDDKNLRVVLKIPLHK